MVSSSYFSISFCWLVLFIFYRQFHVFTEWILVFFNSTPLSPLLPSPTWCILFNKFHPTLPRLCLLFVCGPLHLIDQITSSFLKEEFTEGMGFPVSSCERHRRVWFYQTLLGLYSLILFKAAFYLTLKLFSVYLAAVGWKWLSNGPVGKDIELCIKLILWCCFFLPQSATYNCRSQWPWLSIWDTVSNQGLFLQ